MREINGCFLPDRTTRNLIEPRRMELIFVLSFALFALFFALYKARIKGAIGEKTISSILYFLDKSKYKVINNVVLKNNEITSQIDHIIISDFGIFVIETKNYKGWILGNENSEYWTKVIYKKKYKFYNPILQNSGHIRALKNCLNEFPTVDYKSIIVFSTKAKIKIETTKDVINTYKLFHTIKKYRKVNLTENDKQKIIQKINVSNLANSFDKNKHIRSIEQRLKIRKKSIRENKCPKCGDNLIQKSGKFGSFLGCNSFPKCKFTKNIS